MKTSALFTVFAMFVGLDAGAMTLDPSVYAEVGDAGDFRAAQDVVGTGIRTIRGEIGDPDLTDAFRFHFGGGPLTIQAQAIVPDINSDTGFTLVDLPLALLSIHATPQDPCAPTDPCRGTGLLDLATAGLAAGNYILSVCIPTEPCLGSDPPYTISFSADIAAPVPEPATLGLLGAGLAGLAWRRLRRDSDRLREDPHRPACA